MHAASWRAALAGHLEQGFGSSSLTGVWEALSARAVARPLDLPPQAKVVGIGGSTLGGSGKTPLAIAVAAALADRAAETPAWWSERGVALVGHAYRARPGVPREVRPSDPVAVVGDEALVAAHRLHGSGIPVWIAPTRQLALDEAAKRAGIVVIDGLLQSHPRRLHRSILVVDGHTPWGAGKCPPAGDLRAPRGALLTACDVVAVVCDEDTSQGQRSTLDLGRLAAVENDAASGAWGTPPRPLVVAWGRTEPPPGVVWGHLAGLRTGALLGLARPARVLRALATRGVRPVVVCRFADHLAPSARWLHSAATAARTAGLDAWLATEKCALRLPPRVGGIPVLVLGHRVALDPATLPALLGPREPLEAREPERHATRISQPLETDEDK